MQNCLTYAVGKWRREGGYILIRRSFAWELFGCEDVPWWHPRRLVWLVPHFLHRDYLGRVTQYVPTAEQVRQHRTCLPCFWLSLWHFDGEVIEGNGVVEKYRAALHEGH